MKQRARSNRSFYIYFVLFLTLLTVFLYAVVWVPYSEQEKGVQNTLLQHRFHTDTQSLQTTLSLYMQVLYGARAFFAADEGVTREEWKAYYQSVGVVDQLPGLGMLAYIEQVPDRDKENFIARMRADAFLQRDDVVFDIYPESKKDFYQVATFLEPSEVSTTKSVYGFDFSSDPVRREAFEKARDTNRLIATAPLQFVSNKKAGYVMMLAIYDPLLPIITPEQRRAAYKGLVIISVRIKDVLDSSFSKLAQENVLVQVYDGPLQENDLIYQNIDTYRYKGPTDTTLEEVTVADRTLTIKFTSPTDIQNVPIIPSLWARLAIVFGTNLLTAYIVWARFRPKKI